MEKRRMTLDEVHRLTVDCLEKNGCNSNNARAVANTITAAERDVCPAHGLFRLPGYVASLRSGKVNGNAVPKLETLSPAVIKIRGDRGFAPLALEVGCEPLMVCAREKGIGALVLSDIHHFSALWVEVEAVATQGLCAFAFTSFLPAVAPAGGIKPLFGTNPMAFGWPRRDKRPLVFDQASAAMARGEVMIAARDGHEVRPGVGIDRNGQPTTDPNEILEGAILPFGGYKGSAIALMIELLAGALIGQPFGFEAAEEDNKDGGPPRGGELILAIDPARFGDPDGWSAHAEVMFTKMSEQSGVRLPSNRRYANRRKTETEGVSVPQSLYDTVIGLLA